MTEIVGSFGIVLGAAAVFVAFIMCLALPERLTKRTIGWFAAITAVLALAVYGYGYAMAEEPADPITAILRTAFAAVRIFLGEESWADVQSGLNCPVGRILFWLVHLMGLFTAASAVIAAMGQGLLRKLRLVLLRRRDVSLIFGLNKYTLSFAQALIRRKDQAVAFVAKHPDPALTASAEQMGCIVYEDFGADDCGIRLLDRIGIKFGRRKLRVYAMDGEPAANWRFAEKILSALKLLYIDPYRTKLVLLGFGDETDNRLQKTEEHYGYGSVYAVNEPELTARLLIKHYPPCNVVDFDDQGKAINDFHGIVIGCGQLGQAVLRQLVMNGQFVGNNFRLRVFDPELPNIAGKLFRECESMMEQYDIKFHACDGRSNQFFSYLKQHISKVGYIAVCTGSEEMNSQIARQIRAYLNNMSHRYPACKRTQVYTCSTLGVSCFCGDNTQEDCEVYTPEVLCTDKIDCMAMEINHSYCAGRGDKLANWRKCTHFDKMSNRAAADFYPAFLRAAGMTEEEARANWNPQGPLLKNLAITEHLRWNAFHYAMGFRPMTKEEWDARVRKYQSLKLTEPETTYRIAKDVERRIHACIVPWEELNTVSTKESQVTGKQKDYQKNDFQNVMCISDILNAANTAQKSRR